MRQLGNAAHLLGVLPHQWDLLTVEQEDHLLTWLDEYEKQHKEAEKRMRNS